MKIAALGISHKTAPAEVREKVSVKSSRLPALLEELAGEFEEAVLLSTCNRTEVYVSCLGQDVKERLANVLLNGSHRNKELRSRLYFYSGVEAAEHLFRVASSLDSMVVGETQILGQVKEAYQIALGQNATGGHLNRLFQHSFRVAKRVRSETGIGRGNYSVSSLACRLAEEKLGGLLDKQVMIIGAGKTGEVTLQHLVKKGIKAIFVGNRTFAKAEAMTGRFGGSAIHFKDCLKRLGECDLVISQTSSPHYIIRAGNIPLERKKPLVLVDLAIPRDIEPQAAELEDVFLYNIDSLQEIVDKGLKTREREARKAERIIEEEIEKYLSSICG